MRPPSPKRKIRVTHRHPPGAILCHHQGKQVGCLPSPSWLSMDTGVPPLGSAWILGFPFLKGSLAVHLGQSPLFRTS